jgi:transposase
MSKVVVFEKVNPNSAGVDTGSEKVFVSPDGETVLSYETFTRDYRRCVGDLKAGGIQRVAIEATGVYWIALHEMLEEAGIEVCLVNPKEVKQVKGRKTDVKDCCWIQRVFSAGLLRQSYIPAGKLKELRMLVREREDMIEMGSAYVNKMQKCLELMNIKLTNVLSQIHGVSGIKIIEAIVQGERDSQKLLMLCDSRIIKQKSEKIIKALEGNYNETWLFMLQQNMQMWKQHQQQLLKIDSRIEQLLDVLESSKADPVSIKKAKPIRHHRPVIDNLHERLVKIYGVDGNTVPGINDYTLLRLLGETGTDMSRYPTIKHFVSWCQLAPGQNKSGKINRRVKIKGGNKSGQIFREAAQSIINSKYIAIGAFMRRIRSRKDSAIAIKAGARKIAEAYYNLLTKGNEYVEAGVRQYQEQLEKREKRGLERLAKKYNMVLVEKQHV